MNILNDTGWCSLIILLVSVALYAYGQGLHNYRSWRDL